MKKLFGSLITIVLLLGTFVVAGCDYQSNADKKQRKQTEEMMLEIGRQVGMPNITNFQQKKLMKMVLELCDQENLITYAYIKSDYHGKLYFIGKCIGYGIPFSAQYTNPERPISKSTFHDSSTIPQPDPNGLFMPTSSSATWLMMIDPKTNKPRPVYFEPEIVISPFPLH